MKSAQMPLPNRQESPYQHQNMAQVEQIKADIEALSQDDFIQLREWFAEKDWLLWDKQLEVDIADGKLDFLLEEAIAAKSQGKLQDL